MPFKLSPPLEKKEWLDKTDSMFPPKEELRGTPPKDWPEEDRTYVIIYQAAYSEDVSFNNSHGQLIQEYDQRNPNLMRFLHDPRAGRMMQEGAWLTLGGCNAVQEDGETPLFRFTHDGRRERLEMKREEFNKVFGSLPSIMAEEIWEKVISVNVTWRPGGEASQGDNRGQ